MIGINPSGLLEKDIVDIYTTAGDTDSSIRAWITLLKGLGIVEESTEGDDDSKKALKVNKFIDQYVHQKLSPLSKEQLVIMLATYYNHRLISKRLYQIDLENFQAVEDLLKTYE